MSMILHFLRISILNLDVPTPNFPGPSKSLRFVSPFAVSPVPSIKRKVTNRGKKSSKSEIVTSSPYKNELEISI